jgi:hypothetical protein
MYLVNPLGGFRLPLYLLISKVVRVYQPEQTFVPQAFPLVTARGGPGGRGGSDPGKPLARLFQLGKRRQRIGHAPDTVQPLDPRLPHDRVAEALAQPVLAKLELQPQDPHDHLAQSSPAGAPGLQPTTKAGIAWKEVARSGVHDVLGIPLDHGHRRLEAIERGSLLGPREQAGEVSVQDGANRGAGVGAEEPARQPLQRARVEPRRGAGYQLLDQVAQMRSEPRHGRKLNRMRALVNRNPA